MDDNDINIIFLAGGRVADGEAVPSWRNTAQVHGPMGRIEAMLRRWRSALQRRRDADAASRAQVKRYARRAVQRHDALAVRRRYDDVWPGARLSEGERAEERAVAPL